MLSHPMDSCNMSACKKYRCTSLLRLVTICVAALVFCPLLFGPLLFGQGYDRDRTQPADSRGNRTAELSDLAKENLSRVAASSPQIKEVLVKDAGLLVELKRWVAKEATDNGQVVEDSMLSDQAIFDRLDHDVQFRSVATRLVQRYGYLLPAPNPDSSFGKEEDLVLKERARRLVQIEAQEDNESLRPSTNDRQRGLERTTGCDPQQDADCERTGSRSGLSNRSLGNESSPENEPPASDTNPRSSPDAQPSVPSNRALQTNLL